MQVRTLHLYGTLADRYGSEHPVAAPTISEALRIVDCNHPGFCNTVRRGRYHIAIGSSDLDEAEELPVHHLFVPRSAGDWHLIPVTEGGKSGTAKTIFSIVVGGALLATGIGGAVGAGAFASGGASTAVAFGTSTFMGLSYGTITLMGAAVFLGGINQLLAPAPKADTSEKKPTAWAFDGPGEVDDEGGPIHLILGEVVTGGIRAASSVESTNSASVS